MSNYGQGSITERSPGSFQLRWYNAKLGKYQTKTHRGKKTDARKELNNILSQVYRGTYQSSAKSAVDMTVGTVAERFINDLEIRVSNNDNKARTLAQYSSIIRHRIVPLLGEKAVKDLTSTDVTKFCADLRQSCRVVGKGELSDGSVRLSKTVLHVMFNWAEANNLVKLTANLFPKSRSARKADHLILSMEQIDILLESCETFSYGMPIALAAMTGMRQGEVLGLRWHSVDFANNQIKVVDTLEYAQGVSKFSSTKTGKTRLIPMNSILVDMLKRHKEIQQLQRLDMMGVYNDQDLVCCKLDGNFYFGSEVTRGFQTLLGKLGLPKVRFHDLRHSFASQLLQTRPITEVSAMLGHAGVKMTLDVYAHVMPEQKRGCADDYEASLREAREKRLSK